MPNRLFPHALPLARLGPHWRAVAVPLFLVAALHVGVTLVENLAIVWMDRWLPVQSMTDAELYSLLISTAAQTIRVALVGLAIVVALRPLIRTASPPVPTARFLGFWAAVSAALGVLTLALDGIGYWLQFGGLGLNGVTFRAAFLTLIYAKLIAYFVILAYLFGAGAGAAARAGQQRLRAAHRAIGLGDHALAFGLFLLVWLSIDGVLIPLISYLPFVSPFWFIPAESEPSRYLVGQGTRFTAEAVAFVLYAMLWIRLFGGTLVPAPSADRAATALADGA